MHVCMYVAVFDFSTIGSIYLYGKFYVLGKGTGIRYPLQLLEKYFSFYVVCCVGNDK